MRAEGGGQQRDEPGGEQGRRRRRVVAGRAQHGEAGQVLGSHGDEIERDADSEHRGNIEARRDEFEAGERDLSCRPMGEPAREADGDAGDQRRDDAEEAG